MTSTSGNRELEVREDNKLHAYLRCNAAQRKKTQSTVLYFVHTETLLHGTDNSLGMRKYHSGSAFIWELLPWKKCGQTGRS